MIRHAHHTLTLWLLLLITPATAVDADVNLFFSPHGGCEATICNSIDAAEKDILVAAYAFSSKPIANALYRAHAKGVTVKMLVDRKQPTAHYSMVKTLIDHGLNVRVDYQESMMHMKTMILDGKQLICGSYNFTASAENRNVEILTIIQSKPIAAKAAKNWYRHWNHSEAPRPKRIAAIPVKEKKANKDCPNGLCPLKPSNHLPRSRLRRRVQWSN